jgi:hypothetical protein
LKASRSNLKTPAKRLEELWLYNYFVIYFSLVHK